MTQKCWPVPGGSRTIPSSGMEGSFWEHRGDRWHCGIDLYAPHGSEVHAVEDGTVPETGVMTSRDILPYWNTTYYVLVRHGDRVAKYGELCDVAVSPGDAVACGDPVGHVGTVLDPDAVDGDAPSYIRRLADRGAVSMLHFELYRARPRESEAYLGGNWFDDGRPDGLVDPTEYLRSAARNRQHSRPPKRPG